MPWFLYLIECDDGSLYTGIATDVQARFAAHACGKGARYTRSRKPLAVVASFELAGRSEALRAEYRVKRLKAHQKRALVSGERTLDSVLPRQDENASLKKKQKRERVSGERTLESALPQQDANEAPKKRQKRALVSGELTLDSVLPRQDDQQDENAPPKKKRRRAEENCTTP